MRDELVMMLADLTKFLYQWLLDEELFDYVYELLGLVMFLKTKEYRMLLSLIIYSPSTGCGSCIRLFLNPARGIFDSLFFYLKF